MHIRRKNGQFSIRYIDEASGQGPDWVTGPDNQPFLVETLIDLNNDRISVWVDGVPQDATVDLSGYQSINRADLVLANLDSGTQGTIYLDELIYHDSADLGLEGLGNK